MAFLRFMRDKRGYEHFSLVESTTNRRGKSRTRLLYWYRTPPNVRVGREPFDESVRRALESQNPGVQFDWHKIIETPIPSAETDRWRERRRAEKAEKAARRAEATAAVPGRIEKIDEIADSDESGEIESIDEIDQSQRREEVLSGMPAFEGDAEGESADGLEADDEENVEAIAGATIETDRAAQTVAGGATSAGRRRRRRRGRRNRSGVLPSASSTGPDSSASPAPAARQSDTEAPASDPEGD